VRRGPLRVFVASCGVGITNRGFETLARECFDALREEGILDVTLVKGRGSLRKRELVVPALRRDRRAAEIAGKRLGRDAYFAEQTSFAAGLLPLIAARRPRVVYLSEWHLGKALVRARRRRFTGDYRVLLSNGGPYPPEDLRWPDHVHQLTPTAFEMAQTQGLPPERQTTLPLGLDMTNVQLVGRDERRSLRRALGVPDDRPVLIAVAALAFHHKRLDYLVRELARLPTPRPFLVMLGARGAETPALLDYARKLLGADGFAARTVDPNEVPRYYGAADVFVHASLWEAFGRSMVEALSHGLPCIAHDGATQRYVLDEYGIYGDLSRDGMLAELVPQALAATGDEVRNARHRYARSRFSWERLAPRYTEMITRCAA
jgi:1,2-diacylglycerol 3-alpha-glucosyltransferase